MKDEKPAKTPVAPVAAEDDGQQDGGTADPKQPQGPKPEQTPEEKRKAAEAEAEAKREAERTKALEALKTAATQISTLVGELKKEAPTTTLVGTEAPIESLALAYKAVGTLAGDIAKCIRKAMPNGGRILLHSGPEIAGLTSLSAFEAYCGLFIRRIAKLAAEAKTALAPPAPAGRLESAAATITAAATLASVALNVSSLFRVSNSLTYTAVTVEDRSWSLAIASALKATGDGPAPRPIEVFDPSIAPVGLANWTPAGSAVIDRLSAVIDGRAELEGLRNPIAANKTKADADAAASGASVAAVQLAAQLTDLLARLDAMIAEARTYEAALLKADDPAAAPKLSLLIAAEALRKALGANGRILQVKNIATKGVHRETKYFFKSTLSFSGGAIASFALSDLSGRLIEGGLVTHGPEFAEAP